MTMLAIMTKGACVMRGSATLSSSFFPGTMFIWRRISPGMTICSNKHYPALRPRMALASAGEAISRPYSRQIRTTRATSSALVLARTPRLR